MIPNELQKQFSNVITKKQKSSFPQSKEEKLTLIKQQMGISTHGKGKRKKKTKKRGGKK